MPIPIDSSFNLQQRFLSLSLRSSSRSSASLRPDLCCFLQLRQLLQPPFQLPAILGFHRDDRYSHAFSGNHVAHVRPRSQISARRHNQHLNHTSSFRRILRADEQSAQRNGFHSRNFLPLCGFPRHDRRLRRLHSRISSCSWTDRHALPSAAVQPLGSTVSSCAANCFNH